MNSQVSSLIRFALAALATLLVQRGRLQSDQQELFVNYGLQLLGAALGVVTLFWGQLAHLKERARLVLAAALPASSTLGDLHVHRKAFGFAAVMSEPQTSISWTDIIFIQAINTVLTIISNKDRRGRLARYLIPLRDALNVAFPSS
jgi:hypothetical protein